MSDYLSALPVELIDKILDNISTFDILSSVSFVNKRLRSIVLFYSRFQFDFNSIAKKKNQFDLFCNQLPDFASRIVSLTFNDGIFVNHKIQLFLRSITSNDTFLNLHSITLHHIRARTWNSIRIRLPLFVSLRSISIASIYDGESSTVALMSLIFNDLLFGVRSLTHLNLHILAGCSNDMINITSTDSIQTSNIESLTLEGIQISLHELFSVVPMLSKLKVSVDRIFHQDVLVQFPMNLQQLSIIIKHSTMLEMKRLLSPMTCLTHLTLRIHSVHSDMTDGNAWIPLLRKLVVFKSLFNIISLGKVSLDSFRTQFWLVEKKWYITYDQWSESYSSLLYTNPYCDTHWSQSSHEMERLVTESTGLKPTTFPHVNYLSINNISEMNDVAWTRFTHLDYLAIEQNLNTLFEYITTRLDLSHLTSFTCNRSDIEPPSNDLIRILHNLPKLRSLDLPVSTLLFFFDRKWPKIVDLNIMSSYRFPPEPLIAIQIDSLWRSFNHLETMTFCRESIQDVARLFDNRAMTLSTVMIRHYGNLNDYDPPLITYEWLEKNTKLCQFDYFYNDAKIVFMWI